MKEIFMKKYFLIFMISTFSFVFAKESTLFQQHYTFETQHFIINYEKNTEKSANEIATILEKLYPIYRDKYSITLPKKTNVTVSNSAFSGGWALAIQNTVAIWVNDFDWNMRGTSNWLENVVAHEYAHIVSISNSYKMPYWMPYFQVGKYSHPNSKNVAEIMVIFPSEILPPWFFEGIAQYESYKNGGEKWDSHRDMILRTLVLSDSLLSWDKMAVFSGRGDDYEKAYNHGFSLIKYIAETYGEDKILAIIRESSRFGRLVFDRSIKSVLGISSKKLYDDWKSHLKKIYAAQISELEETTKQEKLTEIGFDNFFPRYSKDENKIYFLSNGVGEGFYKQLYEYDINKIPKDSTDTNKVKMTAPKVNNIYSLNDSDAVIYMSAASLKSRLPHNRGGEFVYDIHKSVLPKDTTKRAMNESVKSDEQLTFAQNYQNPIFSPDGKKIAAISHDYDRHFLIIGNVDGSNFEEVYPQRNDENFAIKTIYSLDWSSDGDNIAVSFMDKNFRKIGIYNLPSKSFYTISDNTCDDRDPRFSKDGKTLYFSSDRSGIFNIYRTKGGEVEQITNLTTGAFTPDVNSQETEIVYAAYSSDGYKIYKAQISPPKEKIGIVFNERELPKFEGELISGSKKKYSYFPRKWLVIPTILSEEIVSDKYDIYKPVNHTKYGVVVGLLDPLFWHDKGNMLTAFYMSGNLFKQISAPFIEMSRNLTVPYDWGLMYESRIFPLDMTFSYFKRNVPTQSYFIHNYYGGDTLSITDYSIQPSQAQVSASKSIMTKYPTNHITLGAFSDYTNFRLQVRIDEYESDKNMLYLWYDPAKIARVGGWFSYGNIPRYSSSNLISPKGFMTQFQWDFNHGQYANDEEVLKIEDGKIKENNEKYNFNSYKLGMFWGTTSLLMDEKVDFALKLNATAIKETSKTKDIPDFFYPAAKVPGYSYSYRADSTVRYLKNDNGRIVDTVSIGEDSLTASGKMLFELHSSYRFPLTSPKGIAKKLWIFYFDKFYGAINFGGAMPAQSIHDLKGKTIDDALLYAGGELRLTTFALNSPLAVGLRYDYGFNRKPPVGGGRFTLSLGFEFSNWTIISQPDGNRFAPEILRGKLR